MKKPFIEQTEIERRVSTASFTQLCYWAKLDSELGELARQEIAERFPE